MSKEFDCVSRWFSVTHGCKKIPDEESCGFFIFSKYCRCEFTRSTAIFVWKLHCSVGAQTQLRNLVKPARVLVKNRMKKRRVIENRLTFPLSRSLSERAPQFSRILCPSIFTPSALAVTPVPLSSLTDERQCWMERVSPAPPSMPALPLNNPLHFWIDPGSPPDFVQSAPHTLILPSYPRLKCPDFLGLFWNSLLIFQFFFEKSFPCFYVVDASDWD